MKHARAADWSLKSDAVKTMLLQDPKRKDGQGASFDNLADGEGEHDGRMRR